MLVMRYMVSPVDLLIEWRNRIVSPKNSTERADRFHLRAPIEWCNSLFRLAPYVAAEVYAISVSMPWNRFLTILPACFLGKVYAGFLSLLFWFPLTFHLNLTLALLVYAFEQRLFISIVRGRADWEYDAQRFLSIHRQSAVTVGMWTAFLSYCGTIASGNTSLLSAALLVPINWMTLSSPFLTVILLAPMALFLPEMCFLPYVFLVLKLLDFVEFTNGRVILFRIWAWVHLFYWMFA